MVVVLYSLVAILVHVCAGYNLEDRLPLFKYGPPGSTFGFSVAMHKRATDKLGKSMTGYSVRVSVN